MTLLKDPVEAPRAWYAFAMAAATLSIAIARLHRYGEREFAGTLADDFFYYAEIAQHVAAGQGSTFDGFTKTNGYQPLWLCVIVALTLLIGPGPNLFFAINCLASLASAVCFLTAERLTSQRLGSSGMLSVTMAAGTALLFYRIASQGMEMILTVPLLLLLLSRPLISVPTTGLTQARKNERYNGLLSALVVLCRLDAIMMVVPFAVLRWLGSESAIWHSLRRAPAWLLGFVPVALYAAINHAQFGRVLPISAAAKQLKPLSLQWKTPDFPLTPLENLVLVDGGLLACVAAAMILAVKGKRLYNAGILASSAAAVGFPLVFYGVHGFLSDWPLWPWHLYPLVVSLPISAAVILRSVSGTNRAVGAALRWNLPTSRLFVCIVLLGGPVASWSAVSLSDHSDHSLFKFGQTIAHFARSHPGLYAMGDRAGIVAYLTDQPVLQLEGLVGDDQMLTRIRVGADLVDTLRDYGVDYYIGSRMLQSGGCFDAAEPVLAGPRSPRMHGSFCAAPLLEFHASDDKVTSRVFAVPKHRSRVRRD
jgi:hypothetical protein